MILQHDPAGNAKPFPSTDAILILGRSPEAGAIPADDLIRRVDCAVQHWKLTNAPVFIPCGGLVPGEHQTDAEIMRGMLMERGVLESIIHPEERFCITIENLRSVHTLLGDGKRVAVVTSDYNIERAMDDWSRAGLRAYAVGAETPEGPFRANMYAEEHRIAEAIRTQR